MRIDNIEDLYELSPMQQGILFHSIYDPGKDIYFQQVSFEIEGELNKTAFEQAWQEALDNHPILRTSFFWEGLPKPLQAVHKRVELPIERIDWRAKSETQQQRGLEEFQDQDQSRAFDLSQAPLMRITLIEIGEQRRRMIWSYHHILLDGWSMPLLLSEVFERYKAHSGGEETSQRRGRPFRDYIAWLQEQEKGEAERYWREKLKGKKEATRLIGAVGKKVGDEGRRGEYGEEVRRLSQEQVRKMKEMSRSYQVTMSTVVQGAWAVLLSRYSGERDVLFGETMSGRPASLEGVEATLGLFVNIVPARIEVEEEERVGEWLRRVQSGQTEAREYDYSGLVEVQGWSEVARGTEMFESIVMYANYPMNGQMKDEIKASTGLEITDVRVIEYTNYPIVVRAMPDDGLWIDICYKREWMEEETARRILEQLEVVIEEMSERPEQRIREISLLTAAERQQLLFDWSSKRGYQVQQCIQELFEAEVEQRGEAIAVTFQEQKITYKEVNRRANQLAHYLKSIGVGPDVLIAINVERSIEMVIGLLGILKAGGAYVPLDSLYPSERISFMLEDTLCPALLTQSSLIDDLPSYWGQMICLDTDWDLIADQSEENPDVETVADNLAYVIYTSGSTGRPKGVAVPHRAVSGLVKQADYAELKSAEVFMQLAPISFDASTFEIWGSLLNGAQLVVMPPGTLSLEELGGAIQRYDITTLWLTAGLFNLMVDQQLDKLRQVHQLLAGGDVLSVRHAQDFLEQVPGATLINGYGPTESTTFACCCSVTDLSQVGESVPIGFPIVNRQVYVLNDYLQPVPTGVIGELYIGGEGLARNYLNRGEMTAEQFIPNPFSTEPGTRIYKTGDMVRYLLDGRLEFIGRLDNQVKLRGYRVEVGEIEAALNAYPFVKDAAVVVAQDLNDNKRLIAYLATGGEHQPAADVVRAYLKQKLPDYMIPASFVCVEQLPLTPNGKIDRGKLASVEQEPARGAEAYVGPGNACQEVLAELWRKYLGVERVSMHDNFFELGGDSILSIQIVAGASRQGVRISPRQVFEHQTIAELSQVAELMGELAERQELVEGEVPLTPIQAWFFEQKLVEPDHWNQAVVLEAAEGMKVELLEEVIKRVVEHHDALRMRFRQQGGEWKQENRGLEEEAGVSVIDLKEVKEAEEEEKIREVGEQVHRSLSISEGPMMRVVVMELSGRRKVMIAIHHLVVDGVSWRILLEDMGEGYEQAARGEKVSLGSKSGSYKEWAEAMREYARSEEMEKQKEYWLREGEEESRRRERGTEGEVKVVKKKLSKEETRELLKEVGGAYQTQIDEVLLVGIGRGYRRWRGKRKVKVEVEGHGRESKEIGVEVARTVGWFTSKYPVELEMSEGGEVGEDIKKVKEEMRRVPSRGIGYGILRYLRGGEEEEKLRRKGEAEISFNYLGQFEQVMRRGIWEKVSREGVGEGRSGKEKRENEIEVTAGVIGGEMEVEWRCKEGEEEGIEEMGEYFMEEVRAIIEHCKRPGVGGFTPSDFPLIDLNQAELDRIVAGRAVEDIYPLTSTQEGMLFHNLYDPERDIYFQQVSFEIEGELNITAFERSWQEALDNHPILRTSFFWEGLPKPLQAVHKRVELPIERIDWRAKSEAQQQRGLEEFQHQDQSRAFDLSQAPLMRITLIEIGEQRRRMIWSYHHILLDGWSMPLLLSEVFERYKAHSGGEETSQRRGRPFRDYIAWLQEQEKSEAERYWREKLKGKKETTRLIGAVGKKVGDEGRRGEYGEEVRRLSQEQVRKMKEMSRSYQVTMSTVVQGAWAVLLSRYSGERDVLFGETVSGRPASLEGVEATLGLFVNIVPARIEVEEEERVGEWLRRVQSGQTEAREYDYSALVEVQGWSEVARGTEMFESIVVYENYPMNVQMQEEIRASTGLEITDVRLVEYTNYPIVIGAMPDEGLWIDICYKREWMEDETARRILEQLEVVIEEMSERPEQRIREISLLTAAERQQLLFDWNSTDEDYPQGWCVNELFEMQVERIPNAIPLMCDGEYLTYIELNRRANQLGRYLRSNGVGPEVIVGICVDRSLDMVIGLLGILKSGAAYLPLDSSYPEERLAYMLEHARTPVLLTQRSMIESMPEFNGKTIYIDSDWDEISNESDVNLRQSATPDNLAYVIYTSGSTGRPKGVQIPHRAVTNLLCSMQSKPGLTDEDILLATTTISFDIAAVELFLPLVTGASVVIVSREVAQDGERLAKQMTDNGVTVMQATPTTWRLLLSADWPGDKRLKILSGGEALSSDLTEQLLSRGRSLWNVYGPTETTIYSMAHQVGSGEGVVPIGRPIANTQIYVLDSNLQPVPAGVAGELYIGGDGLARCYLDQPEATAERFIPNQFAREPSSRIYRTGDIGRHREDGTIEYMGRVDQQVKVRGFRIELQEIETVLAQHPGVNEAVVTTREDRPGSKRLVAYVVQNPRYRRSNRHSQQWQAEQIAQWQAVWDTAYDQSPDLRDPTFNIVGWNSIYTGQLIPEEHMQEWVNHTTERILELRPSRVLELGCGTGLLLFRISPHCLHYCATDASEVAVRYVEQQVTCLGESFSNVTLINRSADDFEGISAKSFDSVIINSVIQYFPSVEYLLDVLEKAVKAVEPGGFIFLGDIYARQLSEAYHCSVQLYQAPASLPVPDLQRRIFERMAKEQELVIDPAFFVTLKQHLEKITDVRILLKRGRYHNELTNFRYDVVLHVGYEEPPVVNCQWLDWKKGKLTLPTLRQSLKDDEPLIFGVTGVPNARTLPEVKALELLMSRNRPATVGELRDALLRTPLDGGVDPEDFWDLAQDFPYEIDLSWTGSSSDGSYDVVFRHNSLADKGMYRVIPPYLDLEPDAEPLTTYVNMPTQRMATSDLAQELRGFLKQKLPDYMMPAAFVMMETLPLAPNGKINRAALPAPNQSRPELNTTFAPPRTPIEKTLVEIWEQVLDLKQVGVNDNFFELGGDSILLFQVTARANRVGLSLTLKQFFDHPTIARLAALDRATVVGYERGNGHKDEAAGGFTLSMNTYEQLFDMSSDAAQQVEDIYPLSPMQQGLLFHSIYAPTSGEYLEQISFQTSISINATAYKQAWQRVIQRHPILRTSFSWKDRDEPLQVVHRQVNFPFEEQDLREMPKYEQERRIKDHIEKEQQGSTFDLSKAPLMHMASFRLEDQTYQFVWSFHQILLDGWSTLLVLKEVHACYEALIEGHDLNLGPTHDYRDYLVWLQQQDLSRAEAFWRQTLKGFTSPTPRPFSRSTPISRSPQFDYSEERLHLSTLTTSDLKSFARWHQVTVNTVLQGAWALILSRLSGQQDVIFGSVVSGRPAELSGSETMVGLFVNTLPVRIQVSRNSKLIPWLKEIQKNQSYARQFEYSSLTQIQKWSEVPSGLRLFESILVFDNYPGDSDETWRYKVWSLLRTGYPLHLDVTPGEEMTFRIAYSSQHYDADTAKRLLNYFKVLLDAMLTNPEARISRLPLLTQQERQQVLVSWNDTKTDYPLDLCFHQLFEAQVERSPETTALVFGDRHSTYGELNRRANLVAHALVGQGVGPEVIVAVLAERSITFWTVVIGILKAGGVYLPLDPRHPIERLSEVIERSGASLVIVGNDFLQKLTEAIAGIPARQGPAVLQVEGLAERGINEENLPLRCGPGNLAYVIFTSGSTGMPKGVMIENIGLVNHLFAKIFTLNLTGEDVVAQNASQCFDISIWQTLAPLLVGGRVSIFDNDAAMQATFMLKQIERDHVSIVETVPSMMRMMIDEIAMTGVDNYELPQLRWLIPNGEPLPTEMCRQWFNFYPMIPIINAYGATECSDDVSQYAISNPVSTTHSHIMPLGYPLPNMRMYILDTELEPIPIGVTGEVHFAGIGVGRGYLNTPELTAERFIPAPFDNEPGARLYKTGDLGYYWPDGNIEFVGRVDYQVKVRGFRIELGEIEAALIKHPAVREAVVVAQGDITSSKRLTAYIVPCDGEKLSIAVLRSYMREKLPDYMVPSAFVELDSMPLNSNGKVDRNALPEMRQANAEIDNDDVVAPRNKFEEVLVAIWREVLELDRVSIYDNFFNLGGHSLLATRVVSRAREALKIELPLRVLFEAPDLASLAEELRLIHLAQHGLDAPPIKPAPYDVDLPLSFAQQRLWFINELQQESFFYNIPIALSLKGLLNVPALNQCLTEIIRRHKILRTTLPSLKGQPFQVIHPLQRLTIPIIDLIELPEDERNRSVKHLAREEARKPFDLSNGPLLRVKLIKTADQEHVVLLTMHHIISDGWSMGLLTTEVAALYEAYSKGEESPLKELEIQYADYAIWQREWMKGEVLEEQMEYWKKQLGGEVRALELRTDKARPKEASYRGKRERMEIGKETSEELREMSRREGVTLFMVLLAVFKVMLHRYTGQEEIAVGTAIANRNRGEIEGLIGFFINTLVMKTEIEGGEGFREVLKRVKEVALGAYAHQDLPLEKLVEELQPERSLNNSPLFQVTFSLQNTPQSVLKLPGLEISPVEYECEAARYDLTVWAWDGGEEIMLDWTYSEDLYEAATIRRMTEHYKRLVQNIVLQPDAWIDSIEMLTEEEKEQQALMQKEWEEDSTRRVMSVKRKAVRVYEDVN